MTARGEGTLYYKLTTANGQTRNGTQWGPGVCHEAIGALTGALCTESWIHVYTDPLLAVLLNPIHGAFERPRCWVVDIDGAIKTDHGLKLGARRVTTIREIPLPHVTREQRVRFALLCALAVYTEPAFRRWAEAWLDGTDRSRAAAWAAEAAAWAAEAAARAARAAAWAAEAAARAARDAWAAWAAEAAARAARAAAWAAEAAAWAAELNLIALAERAMVEE